MMVGAQAANIGYGAHFKLPGCLLGYWTLTWRVARDDFRCGHRIILLCLVAKPSHVGVDVNGLPYHLYCPMDCG
jgi:hypothetical protein